MFFCKNKIYFLIVIFSIFATLSCGPSSNIFGITVPSDHLDTYDVQLDLARAYYDQGKLEKALKYAKRAYSLDPKAEAAVVLYGFINLSIAGGDPFNLAKSLMAKHPPKGSSLLDSDQGPSSTLASLKDAVGIRDDDLEQMASKDDSVADLPLLVPKCVEDVRSTIPRLYYLEQAVLAVCPFINEEIRNLEDYRQVCNKTDFVRQKSNEAHFLWAFAHLTEALGFNAILTYKTGDSNDERTNLEKRVEKVKDIDTTNPANISIFSESLRTVQETIDKIFPFKGECSPVSPTSQLQATLYDLLAVDKAFAVLGNMPPKITESIQKGLEKIKTGGANVTAMRADFTKKMSNNISAKIDALASTKPLTAEEKATLCASAGAIASGTGILPAACL